MHAIVQHEFGPAEALRYEQAPDPEPGAGQVRIAVAAIGILDAAEMVPDDVVLITAAAGGLGALLVHAAGSPPVLLDRPTDPSSLQPGIRPVPLPRWRPPPGTSSAHPATAP